AGVLRAHRDLVLLPGEPRDDVEEEVAIALETEGLIRREGGRAEDDEAALGLLAVVGFGLSGDFGGRRGLDGNGEEHGHRSGRVLVIAAGRLRAERPRGSGYSPGIHTPP